MAHALRNRIQETSTSTGTGNFTLGGALPGYTSIGAQIAYGDTFWYCIEAIDAVGRPTGEWEIGRGTHISVGLIGRTTVLYSSNANALVNFTAGTKRVTPTILSPIGPALADWQEALDLLPEAGGTMRGALNFAPIVTAASAATVNLAPLLSNTITVTGNVTITSFGTLPSGAERTVIFSGSPLLTYNATSMQNPGNRSIQMSPGDMIEMVSLGGGNWNVKSYVPVDGVGIFVKDMTNRFNMVDNGRMMFNERLLASTNIHMGVPVDRWRLIFSGYTTTASQITVGLNGFRNGLELNLGAAKSPAAGDYFAFSHRIEGLNFASANFGGSTAQPIVLSFWSCNSVTGTFPVAFTNSARNRSLVSSYTQLVAGAWELKEILVMPDVTGTWLRDGGIGLEIIFPGAAGTTYNAPSLNTWAAGSYFSTAALTNLTTLNAKIRIKGVQLEVGYRAGTFIHTHVGVETQALMRYYETGFFDFVGYTPGLSTRWDLRTSFKNMKRGVPAVTHSPQTINNISSASIDGANADSLLWVLITNSVSATFIFRSFWIADADI